MIVTEAVGILGGLDIVVNSAGVIHHATAEETTDEQWLETMNVNVNGMFYICRAALPHLKSSKGSIINIASDAALSGSYHLTAYCASKGAVLQMTRAMALDYAGDGVRIVPICPGDVDTPMLRGEFRERGLDPEPGLRESAAGRAPEPRLQCGGSSAYGVVRLPVIRRQIHHRVSPGSRWRQSGLAQNLLIDG